MFLSSLSQEELYKAALQCSWGEGEIEGRIEESKWDLPVLGLLKAANIRGL